MEKLYPVWILVLLAMGVMMLMHHPIQRPFQGSINTVDEAMQSFEPKVSALSTGLFAA